MERLDMKRPSPWGWVGKQLIHVLHESDYFKQIIRKHSRQKKSNYICNSYSTFLLKYFFNIYYFKKYTKIESQKTCKRNRYIYH